MQTLKNIIKLARPWPARPTSEILPRPALSQCGEDLQIQHLLQTVLQEADQNYLDIGANHPFHLSNTALFYVNGWQGVCVDPMRESQELFSRHCPRNVFVKAAVSVHENASVPASRVSPITLATLNKSEADKYVAFDHTLVSLELDDYSYFSCAKLPSERKLEDT